MTGEENVESESSQQQAQQPSGGDAKSSESIYNDKEKEWVAEAQEAFGQKSFDSMSLCRLIRGRVLLEFRFFLLLLLLYTVVQVIDR